MTLWGGRFEDSMSAATWSYTTDDSDRRLLQVDIEGSIAHVKMLGESGIIPTEESMRLQEGLGQILEEAAGGTFEFEETDEDVHTAVERRLGELVGPVAGKLHTGRSRNDQVALDLRLYLKQAAQHRKAQLGTLVSSLGSLAREHSMTVIPSYTHLQQAQATTLGHHLLAYAWMLTRDASRFSSAQHTVDASPLGAGATVGSTLSLDRESTARTLGFREVMVNSLDAVASRDFVSDYVHACAQTMVDLSRLAEEIVLWSSKEFGWVRLADAVSTGSSALPQKRNPDIAELVRGRAATVIGDVTAILTLQKALPLAYNRDLQEDKRMVFHADDTVAASLTAMGSLLEGIEFDPPGPGAETTALDLAEALVSRGVPFREAHQAVGRLVKVLEESGRRLDDVTPGDLVAVDQRFDPSDVALLDPRASALRRAQGGPDSVEDQIGLLAEAWRALDG